MSCLDHTASCQVGFAQQAHHAPENLMHFCNVDFAHAAQVHKLFLSQWDQVDAHELLGAHCSLPGGLHTTL